MVPFAADGRCAARADAGSIDSGLERQVVHPSEARGKVGDAPTRCGWARTPLGIAYHDTEWGVPVHDDVILFEFLTLEGAQAGLSWETILKKREAYRERSSASRAPTPSKLWTR